MALNRHPNVERGNCTTIKIMIGTRSSIIDCIEVNGVLKKQFWLYGMVVVPSHRWKLCGQLLILGHSLIACHLCLLCQVAPQQFYMRTSRPTRECGTFCQSPRFSQK